MENEQPVVGATYILKTPDGRTVEAVVTEIDNGWVRYTSAKRLPRQPRYSSTIEQFMKAAM